MLAYLYIVGYPDPIIVDLEDAIKYTSKCSDSHYEIVGDSHEYV